MPKKIILSNGLRIIVVPRKNTQAVTVLALVGAGSKYETKEINGLAHFLEHMLFKGTKKRSKLEVVEALDRIGGVYNAFTEKEYAGYFAKVASAHFDLALDWVSDIFLNSKIPQREIEAERGVIIEEINMYLDTPMMYLPDIWEKLLYNDQPAGRLILGSKESLRPLVRKQFLDYQANHYTARNTIVCVAGNIDFELAAAKVKKCFKNINQALPREKEKVIEKQIQPQSLIHFKKTDQTHFCLGVRGYDLFHPQRYAQLVLATILGGNMSARLWLAIREKRGLAYHVHTASETHSDSGYLATSVGVANRRIKEVIALILKEYKALKNKKVDKAELQKAKDYLKGTLSLSLESSDAQTLFYGLQELLVGKILTSKEKCARIDQVTTNDIIETAKDIFRPEKLNLALIGPIEKNNNFQNLLKI